MNTTTAERNRAIKKALTTVFDSGISVKGGTGTAYGWVHIKISLPRLEHNHAENLNDMGYCKKCHEIAREIEKKAETIALNAANASGRGIGTYYADDGYNTPHAEILCDVEWLE